MVRLRYGVAVLLGMLALMGCGGQPTVGGGTPTVVISSHGDGSVVSLDSVTLTGTVGGSAVDRLSYSLNGDSVQDVSSSLSQGDFSFSVGKLKPGRNVIRLNARGAAGREGEAELALTAVLEPNDAPEQATPIELAFAGAGLPMTPGDIDWFTFTLDRAATITLDVDAARLGQDIDLFLGLARSIQGTPLDLEGVDFNDDESDASRDPI